MVQISACPGGLESGWYASTNQQSLQQLRRSPAYFRSQPSPSPMKGRARRIWDQACGSAGLWRSLPIGKSNGGTNRQSGRDQACFSCKLAAIVGLGLSQGAATGRRIPSKPCFPSRIPSRVSLKQTSSLITLHSRFQVTKLCQHALLHYRRCRCIELYSSGPRSS